MKLKVLAGAKEGTLVPLKRDQFLIGRSSSCTLRAGSDAISRRHCEILTTDAGVTVRDLGSRNGTLVNGVRISKETPVREGDRLQIGPLEFEFVAEADINRSKKPRVKSVAEAVDRAASQTKGEVAEDDISNWLLGSGHGMSPSSKETTSFKMDDTSTPHVGQFRRTDAPQDEAFSEADPESVVDESPDEPAADESDKGKKKQKKTYGKLPEIPKKPGAKDSREAAADILREMARRR